MFKCLAIQIEVFSSIHITSKDSRATRDCLLVVRCTKNLTMRNALQ